MWIIKATGNLVLMQEQRVTVSALNENKKEKLSHS